MLSSIQHKHYKISVEVSRFLNQNHQRKVISFYQAFITVPHAFSIVFLGRYLFNLYAFILLQVFQTSITQDQLPVLSGWIFEALCHLLSGKVTSHLLPYCLQTLLVSASSNQFIRHISPLCYHILRIGFLKSWEFSANWGIFKDFLSNKVGMSFSDRRLLCVVSIKSNFTGSQIERLKELCNSNECLADLALCLDVQVLG